ATDAGIDLLGGFLRQPPEILLELVVGIVLADAAKGGDQEAAPELGILPPQRIARSPANGGARLAGNGDALPGGRRRLPLGRQDLDLIAVSQLRRERQLPAVDHRADA